MTMASRRAPATWCDCLLLLSISLLVIRCPYSKVEESFNIQAVHDFLHAMGVYDGGNNRIQQFQLFDHLSFPGVVPRTAVGALLLSIAQYPVEMVLRYFSTAISVIFTGRYYVISKFTSQYICRLLLGSASWASITHFAAAFGDKYASVTTTTTTTTLSSSAAEATSVAHRVRGLLVLLLASSFHVPFYCSRTLPNTFAFILILFAWSHWLRGRPYIAIGAVTIAATIFRCDMIVLLAPLGIQLLISREVKPFQAIATGAVTALSSLLISVAIDSLFWERLLWPEGVVLFFNTVQNKSSEWGVMSWHWYFSSALPRALHINLLLCVMGVAGVGLDWTLLLTSGQSLRSRISGFVHINGIFTSTTRFLGYYILPPVIFISLYSLLPHKELRFVLPVLPILASPAAVFLHNALPKGGLWLFRPVWSSVGGCTTVNTTKRVKAVKEHPVLLFFLLAMYIAANLFVTEYIYTAAAVMNYPGGTALHKLLYSHLPSAAQNQSTSKSVYSCHIDEAAAMTGITRFGQENSENLGYGVVYSKEEKLESYRQFDFLLTSDKLSRGKDSYFEVVEEVMGGSYYLQLTH